jgi:hypothetical protein
MDRTTGVEEPTASAPLTRENAGRIVAFLAVLALSAAGGWQAGRILEPAVPVPTFEHGHSDAEQAEE